MTSISGGIYIYNHTINQTEEEALKSLMSIVNMIDTDKFENFMENKDMEDAYYKSLQKDFTGIILNIFILKAMIKMEKLQFMEWIH